MNKRKKSLRLIAAVAGIAIVAAACGSDKKTGGGSTTTKGAAATTTTVAQIPTGGTLTIGAEQEPDCFDWIGSCGGSSWGYWMAQVQTTPSPYLPIPQADGSLKNEPSNLLTGEAEFTASPETIKFHINPKAVWSDGTAITCDDFEYTRDQIVNGKDILSTVGYTDQNPVDCTDESTAVVTFKAGKSYADWKTLYTPLFPKHILTGKDRDTEVKNGYDWSGGPWIAKWTKGDNITLTPNTNYWGDKPKLDKVVFKFEEDTAAEFQAFKSGQVQAIYPQPQIDVIDAISGGGLTDTNTLANPKTAYVEALWINNSHSPLDNKAVRQAIAYSIDRDAIVKQLFGKVGVQKAVNSVNPFAVAAYSNPDATAGYKLDLEKAKTLMEGDGWTKTGDFWTKGGKNAGFTLSTTQGNKRRQLTAEALQQVLKQAGFDMKIKYRTPADLFGKDLSAGDFDVALYANGLTTLSAGQCVSFCSENIPSAANKNSGQNYMRYSNKQVDTLLKTVDTSLDDQARMDSAKQADDLMAADMATLPLDPLPDILIWSKKVVGPVSDNSIMGMFWNINEWGCTGGSCS